MMRLPGCSTAASASPPSPNQAEMAPVRAREQLEDGIGFPVAPDAEHDAFALPTASLFPRKFEP